MADLQRMFKDAWEQALVGLNAAEQEAEKVLGRIADAAGFTPEDVRRHARDFGERLSAQRREIERAIDDAVKKATNRVRIPSRDEVDGLRQRVDALTARLDAMAQERGRPEPGREEVH
ncbi:MAG TPA: phasin family protein [Anaeromyxobacteraceae bacterium]|jgi:polyhydroxyalkanoate synthesis regulator phasin